MKVCLDPGHGGYDPGAVGNGLREKDITLKICLELKQILEFNGITVFLTRDGDFAPGHQEGDLNAELWARVRIAEQNNVDLFVAVHVNAGGGTGEEVLIIGRGGRAEQAANMVLPYLVKAGNWVNRGVKIQNVLVLRETSMPAILTENGFIDHPADAGKLKDPSFYHTLAVAHARGICDYCGIQYKELALPEQQTKVMYRVILDGKQIMALSSQENAIAEVKKAVDQAQAQKGIVQRNTDGQNVFEYTKPQPNPQPAQKTSIMGSESITTEQCQQFLLKVNPNAPDIIPYYKKYGEQLGIKWGYAVAQMIKETGYLKFGGDVKEEQNNFSGLGATGGGAAGASFSTPEEGVLAHLEHVYAYATTNPLPTGMPKVDPRFDLVERGSCPNWEDLDGHWAVPGNGYGEEIVSLYERIADEVVLPEPSESGAIALLKKILNLILDFFRGK